MCLIRQVPRGLGQMENIMRVEMRLYRVVHMTQNRQIGQTMGELWSPVKFWKRQRKDMKKNLSSVMLNAQCFPHWPKIQCYF